MSGIPVCPSRPAATEAPPRSLTLRKGRPARSLWIEPILLAIEDLLQASGYAVSVVTSRRQGRQIAAQPQAPPSEVRDSRKCTEYHVNDDDLCSRSQIGSRSGLKLAHLSWLSRNRPSASCLVQRGAHHEQRATISKSRPVRG